jgi:hypothetical protein
MRRSKGTIAVGVAFVLFVVLVTVPEWLMSNQSIVLESLGLR